MQKVAIFVSACTAVFLSGCAATTHSGPTNSTRTTPIGPVTTSHAAHGMVGAGTNLQVRTVDDISPGTDTPGKTYSAVTTNDIVDQGGNMLVPKGSPAQMSVVASPTGGTTAEGPQLALLSITVNGKTYQVSSVMAQAVPSATAGGQAGTNAAAGTVAASTTGGNSTSGQVVTRGKEMRVPTGSMLTFRLEQAIQLVGHAP